MSETYTRTVSVTYEAEISFEATVGLDSEDVTEMAGELATRMFDPSRSESLMASQQRHGTLDVSFEGPDGSRSEPVSALDIKYPQVTSVSSGHAGPGSW